MAVMAQLAILPFRFKIDGIFMAVMASCHNLPLGYFSQRGRKG